MKKIVNLAYGSVIVGITVLALKYYAYTVTGSLALLSDALESIVNVIASIAMLIAVRFSIRPADNTHHYGHYKAEYFSALFEGLIIVIVALSIFNKLIHLNYNQSHVISAPTIGLLINGSATILNGLWGWIMITHGRKHHSPALVADGKHLLSDVITSVGVAVGVTLTVITGLGALDPLIAFAVAIYLLWTGWHVIKEAFAGLMDAAPNEAEMNKIKKLIVKNYGAAIEAHDIRVRRAGRMMFIDFHLVVSGEMTVSKSHDICDHIEEAIKKKFSSSIITIHVEPEHKVKHAPYIHT